LGQGGSYPLIPAWSVRHPDTPCVSTSPAIGQPSLIRRSSSRRHSQPLNDSPCSSARDRHWPGRTSLRTHPTNAWPRCHPSPLGHRVEARGRPRHRTIPRRLTALQGRFASSRPTMSASAPRRRDDRSHGRPHAPPRPSGQRTSNDQALRRSAAARATRPGTNHTAERSASDVGVGECKSRVRAPTPGQLPGPCVSRTRPPHQRQLRRSSSMAEHWLCNPATRVRFP
jgi:hypothetical protein